MGRRVPIPRRVLLPCVALSLVVFTAIASVWVTRGLLIRQADDDLQGCLRSMLSRPFLAGPYAGPGYGPALPGSCGVELLSANGLLLTPAAGSGPAIPAKGSWLAAHVGSPVTLPDAGTGAPWRVAPEPVHYRPQRIMYVYGPDNVRYLISGRAGTGPGGVLVAMTELSGVAGLTARSAGHYAGVAGAIVALLGGAVFVVTRPVMRRRHQAAECAKRAEAEDSANRARHPPDTTPRGMTQVMAGSDEIRLEPWRPVTHLRAGQARSASYASTARGSFRAFGRCVPFGLFCSYRPGRRHGSSVD